MTPTSYLAKVSHLLQVHGLVLSAPERAYNLRAALCQLIDDVGSNKTICTKYCGY